MRLSDEFISNILKGLGELQGLPTQYELYLFGSRAFDTKKGGDIDLLLIVDLPDPAFDGLMLRKHYLISACKKYIDDQRLDLTLLNKKTLHSNEFYKTIQSDLVRLN